MWLGKLWMKLRFIIKFKKIRKSFNKVKGSKMPMKEKLQTVETRNKSKILSLFYKMPIVEKAFKFRVL
jgi:hypothetical protein